MIDLLQATKTRFEGDATLTALGNLWLGQAPATDSSNNPLVPPYARVFIVASSNDDAFGGAKVENTQLQFTIFANLPTTAKTYYDALLARFTNSTSMTVTGGTFMGMQRLSQHCDIEPSGYDRNGKPVYHVWARFRCKINRTA